MEISISHSILSGLVQVVLSLLLLALEVHSDLCEPLVPPQRPELCPTGVPTGEIQILPEGKLRIDCPVKVCVSEQRSQCKLTSVIPKDSSIILKSFNVSQCTTNLESGINFLGVNFSWRINTTENVQDKLTLRVAVSHEDYPSAFLQLGISLTNETIADQRNGHFSTECIPLEMVQNWHQLVFQAQISPGEMEAVFEKELFLNYPCSEVPYSLKDVCVAPPLHRPELTPHCTNGTMPSIIVTVPPGRPPGINDHSESFKVEIRLKEEEQALPFKTENIILANVVPRSEVPSVTFPNVPPGTYRAQFAFLNKYDQACGGVYYPSYDAVTIKENECASVTSRPPGTKLPAGTKLPPGTTLPPEANFISQLIQWIILGAIVLMLFVLAVVVITSAVMQHQRNVKASLRPTAHNTIRPEQNGLPSIADTVLWEKYQKERMDEFIDDTLQSVSVVYAPTTDLRSGSSQSIPDTLLLEKHMHQYLDREHRNNPERCRQLSADSGVTATDDKSFADSASFAFSN